MAFDLGMHCLPMSHKKDARFIWVNRIHHFVNFSGKSIDSMRTRLDYCTLCLPKITGKYHGCSLVKFFHVYKNFFTCIKKNLQKLDTPASNRGFQNATSDDRADIPLSFE